MRLGIVIWSVVCSWCLFHSIGFYQNNNIDFAIMFGAAFMVGLYLFIAKTVEYIKEDFPMHMRINVSQNKEEEHKDDSV